MENKLNTPKRNITRDKYLEVVDNFVKKLENNAVEPWTKTWALSSGMPKNFTTDNTYNGMNVLTLLDKGYRDSRWLTFQQVKKLGGSIIKGETSTPIFFMKPIEQEERHPETREVEVKKYFLMQSYQVFNLEQTSGIQYEPEAKREAGSTEDVAIQNFIKNIGIEIYRGEPAYSPSKDVIFMPNKEDFDTNEDYTHTLLHEFSHSTGHPSRLDRLDSNARFGDNAYAFEELVAELSATLLSKEMGLELGKNVEMNSASYLQSWIKALKENPNILYSAASKASQSANHLFSINEIKNNLRIEYGDKIDLASSIARQNTSSPKMNTTKKSMSPKIA